jgi:hypothetical protein
LAIEKEEDHVGKGGSKRQKDTPEKESSPKEHREGKGKIHTQGRHTKEQPDINSTQSERRESAPHKALTCQNKGIYGARMGKHHGRSHRTLTSYMCKYARG